MLAALAAFRADAGYVAVAAPESSLPVLETSAARGRQAAAARGRRGPAAPARGRCDSRGGREGGRRRDRAGARSQRRHGRARADPARAPRVPVVLDADALWELEPFVRERADGPDTAHRRARAPARRDERARSTRTGSSRCAVPRRGSASVVLLKGADTLVAAPREGVLVASYGTPALATAGSGDVLTGVVACFLAKGMDPQLGAATAAVAHGVAAELVEPQRGRDRLRPAAGAAARACRARPAARAARLMRSEITIDLGALRRNVRSLLRTLDGAELWAVVKADAYGHGAVDCGGAALDAGATALCVATVAGGARPAAGAAVGADHRPRADVEPRGRPGARRRARARRRERRHPGGRARAREARHGDGALGRVGAADAHARGRRRDDASRHRRQRPRLRARPGRAVSRGDGPGLRI